MGGHIHLQFDDPGNPILEDHNGNVLSTSGTTTKGIQEAIIFAEALCRPLVVDGWSDFIDVTGSIKFGSTRGQHYEFRGVLLRSTAAGPAITLDAPVFIGLDWTGHIEYAGSGSEVVLFDPQTPAPGIFGTAGGGRIHKFGDIHLPFLYVQTGLNPAPQTVTRFRTVGGSLVDQRIKIDGVHGGLVAQNGILVENPFDDPALPGVSQSFAENHIDFGFIGACTSVALQVGTGQIDHQVTPVNTTHWIGQINTDGAIVNGVHDTNHQMTAYLATFAEHDIYDILSMSINAGRVQWGAIFNASSRGNVARLTQIQTDPAGNVVFFAGSLNKVWAPHTIGGPAVGSGANGNELIQ